MKLVLTIALFCLTFGNVFASNAGNEKEKTERKKNEGEDSYRKKNAHSVKKWKISIEYTNGGVISKTISVDANSEISALEAAFEEADKYLKKERKVKDYTISPVTDSYVLLAGN